MMDKKQHQMETIDRLIKENMQLKADLKKALAEPFCKGKNCKATKDDLNHSNECIAEHLETIRPTSTEKGI